MRERENEREENIAIERCDFGSQKKNGQKVTDLADQRMLEAKRLSAGRSCEKQPNSGSRT